MAICRSSVFRQQGQLSASGIFRTDFQLLSVITALLKMGSF